MSDELQATHVVFYDGVCRLCDRTVQFLLGIDRRQILTFAPLQGKTAKRLAQRDPRFRNLETMVFVESYGTDLERISSRSTGILRMLARVGGFWHVVSWLRAVPTPLRDWVYQTVARHRYRWFGRFDVCKLPEAEGSARFLD